MAKNYKKIITKYVLDTLAIEYDDKKLVKYTKNFFILSTNCNLSNMRLTEMGHEAFERANIKKYKIDFPEIFYPNNQFLLDCGRFVTGPFFLSEDSITVYNEKVAVDLILHEGDIQKYLRIRAQKKHQSYHLSY